MRAIDTNTLNALKGSRTGDKLTVYAWYNGRLSYPDPLPIAKWDMDWDIGRQVQKFSCTVADKEGELAPWLLEDPLGVGGGLLQVRYDVGGAGSVNIGWYRIAGSAPEERWHSYLIDSKGYVNVNSPIPNNKELVYVSGGATIAVTAYDLAINAKNDRLLAPESPPSTGPAPTAVSEIGRLMRDSAPVVTVTGVSDRTVSRNLVYDRDRLDAVQDLAKRIFCDYRMNGEGQMEIYPVTQQSPVAVLQGGPEGLLVKVDRSQSIEGLYNRAVVDGTDDSDPTHSIPIRSVAQIEYGPLSVYGPHGRIPEFYSSNMISTQADADNYAQTMIATQLSGMTVDLRVTALPLPHLQIGDWVQVGNPVVNGKPVDLVGKVKTMQLKQGDGLAAGPMELTVQCSYWQVQSAIGGARQRVRY